MTYFRLSSAISIGHSWFRPIWKFCQVVQTKWWLRQVLKYNLASNQGKSLFGARFLFLIYCMFKTKFSRHNKNLETKKVGGTPPPRGYGPGDRAIAFALKALQPFETFTHLFVWRKLAWSFWCESVFWVIRERWSLEAHQAEENLFERCLRHCVVFDGQRLPSFFHQLENLSGPKIAAV